MVARERRHLPKPAVANLSRTYADAGAEPRQRVADSVRKWDVREAPPLPT
jgi:hypothetical protein